MLAEKKASFQARRRYGSEKAVHDLTGISPKTLQKQRIFGVGFPFYKVGKRVLYDLDEVEAVIRANRVGAA